MRRSHKKAYKIAANNYSITQPWAWVIYYSTTSCAIYIRQNVNNTAITVFHDEYKNNK